MNALPPSAMDLLHVASETLRDELLPAVPAAQRHAALMLSHALGIVGRELTMAEHLLEMEAGVLSRFVAGGGANAVDVALDGRVQGLRRQLRAALRSGQLDGQENELLDALRSLVRLRCSVDAPKVLA